MSIADRYHILGTTPQREHLKLIISQKQTISNNGSSPRMDVRTTENEVIFSAPLVALVAADLKYLCEVLLVPQMKRFQGTRSMERNESEDR